MTTVRAKGRLGRGAGAHVAALVAMAAVGLGATGCIRTPEVRVSPQVRFLLFKCAEQSVEALGFKKDDRLTATSDSLQLLNMNADVVDVGIRTDPQLATAWVHARPRTMQSLGPHDGSIKLRTQTSAVAEDAARRVNAHCGEQAALRVPSRDH